MAQDDNLCTDYNCQDMDCIYNPRLDWLKRRRLKKMTNDSCPHRYGCDDYRYGHCDGCNMAKVKTNADLFKQTFGIYATEIWSMSESQFLEWLNEEVKR